MPRAIGQSLGPGGHGPFLRHNKGRHLRREGQRLGPRYSESQRSGEDRGHGITRSDRIAHLGRKSRLPPCATLLEDERTVRAAAQHGTRKTEFANQSVEEHLFITPRTEHLRDRAQFQGVELERAAMPQSPEDDFLVEKRRAKVQVGEEDCAGGAGFCGESADGKS